MVLANPDYKAYRQAPYTHLVWSLCWQEGMPAKTPEMQAKIGTYIERSIS